MIHLIISKLTYIKDKGLKKFIAYVVAILQSSTDIEEIHGTFNYLSILLLSETNHRECERSLEELQAVIMSNTSTNTEDAVFDVQDDNPAHS